MSKSPNYRARLLDNLVEYKSAKLGPIPAGEFKHGGRVHLLEHVLPREQPWLNIPERARALVQQYCTEKRIKRHRYFHHLNSSQAFALSLFVPFYLGDARDRDSLARALGGQTLSDLRLEDIPDKGEASNLDAVWKHGDNVQTVCEIKLSEQEFGVAANDLAHRTKRDRIYRDVLEHFVAAELLETDRFFLSYQILRNLWHAARIEGGRVLFLYPRENSVLTKKLKETLRYVAPDFRERISIAFVEDVLITLANDQRSSPNARSYAAELCEKYII